MNKQDILKEYKNFLNDTNKPDNKKSKNEFKKDFLTWYIELFGIDDERTKNIIEELKAI